MTSSTLRIDSGGRLLKKKKHFPKTLHPIYYIMGLENHLTIIFSILYMQQSSQLLGFADDADVVGRNMDVVKERFLDFEARRSNFGLKVSEEKTEYMIVSEPKRLLWTKPEGRRTAGIPKVRWMDAATANLKTLGVRSFERQLRIGLVGEGKDLERAVVPDK